MIYDRRITISCGTSRRAVNWASQTIMISELYAKLAHPQRSTESLAAYMAMPKAQQDDLKDVGGFVGGQLAGGRRKASAVLGRDLITLDLDHVAPGGAPALLQRIGSLGCNYCVYSTRKHSSAAPRLRVLLPLDRTVAADEYEAIARKVAEMICIDAADPSTFEASRLMYYPSCCADSEYVYTYGDLPLLSADGMLALYTDWHDMTSWPQVPGATKTPQRLAAKQEDPETKSGIVGAFCRTYDVRRALEVFLPGVYDAVDGMDDRLTFTGGSTTGGALIYDDGKYLFSHHATDPCSGKLVNAFDLVRLHKFSDLDDEALPGTPTNRLPSYEAMQRLAADDAGVKSTMAREKAAQIAEAFGGTAANSADVEWQTRLTTHSKTGLPLPTIDNIWLILENDPQLKDKFALNQFAGRGEVLGPLPWDRETSRRPWSDNDNAGLYWYMERFYGITGNGKIDSALSVHSTRHAFNDVVSYLGGLQWDGTPRLETMLIDYLGAEDTPYIRAVTRKAFTAAVARAMTPGSKYDQMLIIGGPQGIGKSTLLFKLSRGWYNDSIRTFEGKEASELLQGVWLVEIAELQAFRASDTSRIKQFVSQQADRFRAAYGRHVKEMPRRCVFFGTTNSSTYLRDYTGGRRFWPVDAGVQPAKKSVFHELDGEVDQLWAEAVAYWRIGEPLYLTGDLADAAAEEQESHREVSPCEGAIAEFLCRQVPADWSKWPQQRRMIFWNGGTVGETVSLVGRDRICVQEVWCEALGGDLKLMKYSDAQEINEIIARTPGWKKEKKAMRFGPYGPQKGFTKV